MSKAFIIESKFDVGVPSGKLSWPPKNCMPSRAKMNMNKKRRSRRDIMEERAFIRAITRLRSGDQYLKRLSQIRIVISISTSVIPPYGSQKAPVK